MRKYLTNKEIYEKRACWSQKASEFKNIQEQIMKIVVELKDSFGVLDKLCDKEANAREASKLDMSEMGHYLNQRASEALAVSRALFLELNSGSFKTLLQGANHRLRKRISARDNQILRTAEPEFIVFKHSATWEECLDELDLNWKVSTKGANLEFHHFEQCKNLFSSSVLRDDYFIYAEDMLSWLKIKDKRSQALLVLVKNLPILQIKSAEMSILISIPTFMNSPKMMTDFMTFCDPKTSEVEEIETYEGVLDETHRKPGSGRPRIVHQIPEVLNSVEAFTEGAGCAADRRRQDGAGRFGFTVKDVWKEIRDKLFKDNPEKAPSQATIRRIFEPPTKAAASRTYYKSDIAARPGNKSNNAPAGGARHPHQHECFSMVKMMR